MFLRIITFALGIITKRRSAKKRQQKRDGNRH